MSKKHIAVLCGGQSTEHDISILSTRNVVSALDERKYQIHVIYISRQGRWFVLDQWQDLLTTEPSLLIEEKKAQLLLLMPGDPQGPFVLHERPSLALPVDCVFPVMHGSLGEDGAVQGLLEMLNLAYVGSGVLGSSLCIEKHITKRLLHQAGLPTPHWQLIRQVECEQFNYDMLVRELGSPMMVKPTNLGSSIGITKVHNAEQFNKALDKVFLYEEKAIIEQVVVGREIECSVLGNEQPVASLPGEIVFRKHEFYSFEAKYLDPDSATVISPANLSAEQVAEVQALSVAACQVLECQGMVRVDFFLTPEGRFIINELNTIPGFTNISMYPKNWQASGMEYGALLDELINLALARWQREQSYSRVILDSIEKYHDRDVRSSQTA